MNLPKLSEFRLAIIIKEIKIDFDRFKTFQLKQYKLDPKKSAQKDFKCQLFMHFALSGEKDSDKVFLNE